MKSSVKNSSTKKLAALLVALVVILATAFACGFTSKSANADTSLSYTVYRNVEYEISDKGHMKEDYDTFDWGVFNRTYDQMRDDGFGYVTVTVEFSIKEKHDGYQQVYLYSSTGGQYDSYIQRIEFQYGQNKKIKDYNNVTIEFKSLPLSDFLVSNELNLLVVRYGATGFGEDTWYNKYMSMTVTVSTTDTRRYNAAHGNNVVFDSGYNNP